MTTPPDRRPDSIKITAEWNIEIPDRPPPVEPPPDGSGTTVLEQDGVRITFQGVHEHGTYVDDEMIWIVPPPDGFLPPAVEIMEGETQDLLLGKGMMLDPDYLVHHPFDDRLATNGLGPGLTYDASLAIPLDEPIDHYPDDSPKTLWIARLQDTVENGASFSGMAYFIHITLVSSAPAADAIKPTSFHTTGGKRQLTTGDLDYDALPTLAIPPGAVEPDWSQMRGYLRRSIVQSGDFNPTVYAITNFLAPDRTQNRYAAEQSIWTGQLLLGAMSNSVHRAMLIERVVRAALDVEGQLDWPNSRCIAGGGHTQGYAPIIFLASFFADIPDWRTTPGDVEVWHEEYARPYFNEHGAWYIGAGGKPLYGAINFIGWPSDPATFGDNHDQRDPSGEREPHWTMKYSGTAQGGSVNTIQMAASTPAMPGCPPIGYNIYISSGTSAGSVRRVLRWDDITKTATMEFDWQNGAPDSTSVYEYYNGGEYHFLVPSYGMGNAIAVVASGKSAEWQAYDPSGAYLFAHQRFIKDNGELNPRYPGPTGNNGYDQSTYHQNYRKFQDPERHWVALFYDAHAEPIWPQLPR